jgi:hypothetical protein
LLKAADIVVIPRADDSAEAPNPNAATTATLILKTGR